MLMEHNGHVMFPREICNAISNYSFGQYARAVQYMFISIGWEVCSPY